MGADLPLVAAGGTVVIAVVVPAVGRALMSWSMEQCLLFAFFGVYIPLVLGFVFRAGPASAAPAPVIVRKVSAAEIAAEAAEIGWDASRALAWIALCDVAEATVPFEVNVMVGMDGTEVKVTASQLMWVLELKGKIAEASGLAVHTQQLYGLDGELADGQRIGQCGVTAESALVQVVVKEVDMWTWHKKRGAKGEVVTEVWQFEDNVG